MVKKALLFSVLFMEVVFLNGQLILQSRADILSSVVVSEVNASYDTPEDVYTPEVVQIEAPVEPVSEVQTPPIVIIPPAVISLKIGSVGEEILFESEKDKELPVASLTKLMTALVASKYYEPDQQITVSPEATAQEGDQGSLQLGQVLTVKNLLYVSLIESSNKAAYSLSELMGTQEFVAAMNKEAQELGLTHTHFADPTGLSAQSYSTAYDVARLSKHIFENYPLLKEMISYKTFDLYVNGMFHHRLVNTNKLLEEMPVIVGGKTGWTNSARGCFMTIEQVEGGYIIHVVLGAEDRLLEMRKLIAQ